MAFRDLQKPRGRPINILVLNAGSSSYKSCLYRLPKGGVLPTDAPRPQWERQSSADADGTTRAESLRALIGSLWSGPGAVIGGPGEIDAVGHRVVHGGADFRDTVRITPEVKAAIRDLCDLAPAHNPAALDGIDAAQALLGETVPQFAVFDTAFHRDIPNAAAVYPGPYDWVEQGIRRYGFHGINHQYVADRAARLLGRPLANLRMVSCHLGNGCSLAAIRNGKSVDTTMGFTPMEGLMMGSRSGSVDPGIPLYLMRRHGYDAEKLDRMLNRESGLKGISGISEDMREIAAARVRGDARAQLAFDIYVHRLSAGIAAMVPSLGGVDALIFTGGVGEHDAELRNVVCERLSFLGIQLSAEQNEAAPAGDRNIAATGSAVGVWVIRAEEDWAIAGECAAFFLAPPSPVRKVADDFPTLVPRSQGKGTGG